MKIFGQVISRISDAKKLIICGHIMPDGDCVSSVLSLSIGLQRWGKDARPAIDWPIPHEFDGFPFVETIDSFCEDMVSPDLIVAVDSSSADRLGRFSSFLGEGVPSVVIDHHATNSLFGDTNLVDTSFSSTAQMVLRLLRFMEIEYDQDLALLNYLGIATDTGFFRYSGVDETVFRDAAELVKMGADPAFVAMQILERNRIEDLYLKRDAISNLELCHSGLVAFSYLNEGAFKKYGVKEDEFSGFVNELRAIDSVEIAVFASESKEGIAHVSMRSKTFFDVSFVAKAFGGGGHKNAAGFTMSYGGNLREALEEILSFIGNVLREAQPDNPS